MTMIRIDPQELSAAASTIRSAAVETADIGAQLAACVSCPMPADVAPLVDQIVGTVDRILDQVAVWFNGEANDLSNRAALASSDLAAAGSMADSGGLYPSTMTLGGNSSPGFTIVDPNSGQQIDPASLLSGSAMIGGNVVGSTTTLIDPTTGLPGSLLGGSVTIGGGTRYGDNPAMILAEAAQKHRDKATAIGNRILANPNSSQSAINAVFNSQISMNESITRSLAPSRSSMENKVGHLLTLGEYYDLVPEARPPAGSLLL